MRQRSSATSRDPPLRSSAGLYGSMESVLPRNRLTSASTSKTSGGSTQYSVATAAAPPPAHFRPASGGVMHDHSRADSRISHQSLSSSIVSSSSSNSSSSSSNSNNNNGNSSATNPTRTPKHAGLKSVEQRARNKISPGPENAVTSSTSTPGASHRAGPTAPSSGSSSARAPSASSGTEPDNLASYRRYSTYTAGLKGKVSLLIIAAIFLSHCQRVDSGFPPVVSAMQCGGFHSTGRPRASLENVAWSGIIPTLQATLGS